MGTSRGRGAVAWTATVLLCLAWPSPAVAQTNLQLWSNLTVDWVKSSLLTYELDIEPKVLVTAPEGEAAWRNVDVTPNVDYSATPWLDLVGEVSTGYTRQTDDVNTFELTPRAGVRFHLFSRAVPTVGLRVREMLPRRRVVVRDLVRVEARNLFYSGAAGGSDSTVRFRNRLELLVPLNMERLNEDGARYFLADWEWFLPVDDAEERFANKQRIRTGFGYRRSFDWRFEALYIWTRSRNTIEDDFATSDNAINIRVKRIF